ncbi:uncharacterized protein F4822DRAFT_425950 [Hypoxylon trugodes]|uniref:uncharacterized protein n=1 Tax=Hypoxylon trugodes TaxID=326681 RepID=UPI002191BFCD|nr:uncharacterized protein F4822DRAFT_425950 [Hypoxylon trugodes]KAI1392744.1 hypothetical protein F4822DRAFT_425950 [Hypoxylon trugodes]
MPMNSSFCYRKNNEKKSRDIRETERKPEYLTGYPFKIECAHQGWTGNLPCVYGPHNGCSHHNPLLLPIAYNQHIPSSKKRWILERCPGPPNMDDYDEVQQSERIWSRLPPKLATVDPLDPIHPSIRYALAFYHLDWIRRARYPQAQMERARSLACHAVVTGEGNRRPELAYWIDPYWQDGSVLLRQIVRLVIEPKKENRILGREYVMLQWPWGKWTFQTCPHHRHRFRMCEFQKTRGLVKATMSYKTKIRISSGVWAGIQTNWRSTYGPSERTWNCRDCCTDGLVTIDLVEDKIGVYLYTWKDLGKANDAYDNKWIAALRSNGPEFVRPRPGTDRQPVRSAVQAAINEIESDWVLTGKW